MKKYIIKNNQYKLIVETIQQAEKFYFSTNKITPEEKNIILNFTKGDNYTYAVATAYLIFKDFDETKKFYELLKNYNNKIFPIKEYNNLLKNLNNKANLYELYRSMQQRDNIIFYFNKLPNILKRNIKEKNIPKDLNQLTRFDHLLNYLQTQISQLSNRPEHIRNAILKKAFSSKFETLEQITDFFDEKENLIGGKKITKKEIIYTINNNNLDANIVYDKNNIMVIEIWSPETMQMLGCNSLWCFTYGSNDYEHMYYQFNNYSTNGIVYMIINFNIPQDEKNFMNILIKPLDEYSHEDENNEPEHILFDLTNEGIYEPTKYLENLFKINKKQLNKLFNFDI